MSKQPFLSVVIPIRDNAQGLEYTASSLRHQTLSQAEWEVILVDDGSVIPAAAAFVDTPEYLQVVRLDPGAGRAAARNAGIEQARGEVVLMLDGDTFAAPQLLERHWSFHRSAVVGEKRVLLGTRYESSWETVTRLEANDTTRPKHAIEQDLRSQILAVDESRIANYATPWALCFTHNMSVHRSTLRAIDGFDETFRGWGDEDVELGYRLFAQAGRKPGYFVLDPEAYSFHLPHFHDVPAMNVEAESNRLHFRHKHLRYDVEVYRQQPRPMLESKVRYYDGILEHFRSAKLGQLPATTLNSLVPSDDALLVVGGTARQHRTGRMATFDHCSPADTANWHLLGLATPFEDNAWRAVVAVDLWRYLLPYDIDALVVEALRIGAVLHLVTTPDLRPSRLGHGLSPEYLRRMLTPRFAVREHTVNGCHVLTVTTSVTA